MRPDILVTGAPGVPLLAVEVKARRGVGRQWAAQLRRNLNAHGPTIQPRFFMILTTDETYLWREADHDPLSIVPPDAEVATADLLEGDVAAIDGRALELQASAWLNGLTVAGFAETREPVRRFLIDTGLADALKGATVNFQVA
jgi:hypothetical protein